MYRLLPLAALLAACSGPKPITVGDARPAMADGVYEPPPGVDVPVLPGHTPELPDAEVIRLAFDFKVKYADAAVLIARARERGVEPVLLVKTYRNQLRAISLPPAESRDGAILVTATADGKACISLPDAAEAKCVKTPAGGIDRAWTRDVVREAYKASGLTRAVVELEGALTWGDAIRAVDAARTCCRRENIDMTVGVINF